MKSIGSSLTVTLIQSDTDDIVLFDGQIESCKKKNDRRFRDIVAYDYLHYLDENSNIIISDFFKSGDYGLVDSHNKGEWVQGTLYKKGDVIHCDYTIPQGGSSYLDMSAWYEYLQPVNKGQSKWNPYELYTGYFDSQYNIKGSEILKKLTKNKKATTTVKKIRDKLFEYLGEVFDFKQQETTLPMDNVTLWIKPFSSNMTLMQLLDYICNLNGVFGFYNPHTAQFEYVAPPDVSTPYNIGRIMIWMVQSIQTTYLNASHLTLLIVMEIHYRVQQISRQCRLNTVFC